MQKHFPLRKFDEFITQSVLFYIYHWNYSAAWSRLISSDGVQSRRILACLLCGGLLIPKGRLSPCRTKPYELNPNIQSCPRPRFPRDLRGGCTRLSPCPPPPGAGEGAGGRPPAVRPPRPPLRHHRGAGAADGCWWGGGEGEGRGAGKRIMYPIPDSIESVKGAMVELPLFMPLGKLAPNRLFAFFTARTTQLAPPRSWPIVHTSHPGRGPFSLGRGLECDPR